MMKKACIFLIALFLAGCMPVPEYKTYAFDALQKSFEHSIGCLSAGGMTYYFNLEQKNKDPKTHERASVWLSKAERCYELTDSVVDYMQYLKREISWTADYRLKKTSVTNEIMLTRGRASDLFYKLVRYMDQIDALHPDIKVEMNGIQPFPIGRTASGFNPRDFGKFYFEDREPRFALLMLDQFINNVIIIRYEVFQFCDDQVKVFAD